MKRILFTVALLAPVALSAQVSVLSVVSSPSPPTFADAITFKIEVQAPSSCVFDEEAIEAEDLPNYLALTLPGCASDSSPLVTHSLLKLVEHQLPGDYLFEIFSGSSDAPGTMIGPDVDPPLPEPLWSGSLQVLDLPEDLSKQEPIEPSLSCDTPTSSGEPCAYQKALADKLKLGLNPSPQFNWQSKLDWNFDNWKNGGSQNLPTLAQALALVMGTPDLARTKAWWNKFFDCQLGQTCSVPNPGNLVYFSGGEILSNIYNEHSLLAAMVVNYWATRSPTRDLPLANKARRYLRSAWYLYTLAAGNGPAKNYFENGGTIPTTCQWATANNRYFYDGPFLALAGGRSKPTDGCLDDRAPLFAQAIRWEGFTRSGENREQRDLRQFVEDGFLSETLGSTETVFGIDQTLRTDLKAHVRNTQNLARWLVTQLNAGNAKVRLSREMRFLGWNGGIRASVLAENPNTCSTCENGTCGQTAAVYATKYDPRNQGEASFLFPWAGGVRRGLTRGYGKVLPNPTAPTQFEASNRTTGDTAFSCQPFQVVRFSLPVTGLLYQVAIGPAGATCVSCA